MKKLITTLFSLAILICMPQLVHATSLFPQDIGVWYQYERHDSASPQNEWTVKWEILDKVMIGPQEYMKVGISDYDGLGDYSEIFVRSTETAIYSWDNELATEILGIQTGAIGTTWEFPHMAGGLSGKTIKEIINIEQVTVPFGTFNEAYVLKSYFDYDDPLKENSSPFYEYVVPGIGIVQEIDYNLSSGQLNGPYVQELVKVGQVVVTPEPASMVLFGLGGAGMAFARRRMKMHA